MLIWYDFKAFGYSIKVKSNYKMDISGFLKMIKSESWALGGWGGGGSAYTLPLLSTSYLPSQYFHILLTSVFASYVWLT